MDTSNLAIQAFHKGTEAAMLLSKVDTWKVVLKRPIRKEYPHESLDNLIRQERTLTEAFDMSEAKAAGVKVPSIIGIEQETNTILMTHVDGTVVRDSLDGMKLI